MEGTCHLPSGIRQHSGQLGWAVRAVRLAWCTPLPSNPPVHILALSASPSLLTCAAGRAISPLSDQRGCMLGAKHQRPQRRQLPHQHLDRRLAAHHSFPRGPPAAGSKPVEQRQDSPSSSHPRLQRQHQLWQQRSSWAAISCTSGPTDLPPPPRGLHLPAAAGVPPLSWSEQHEAGAASAASPSLQHGRSCSGGSAIWRGAGGPTNHPVCHLQQAPLASSHASQAQTSRVTSRGRQPDGLSIAPFPSPARARSRCGTPDACMPCWHQALGTGGAGLAVL